MKKTFLLYFLTILILIFLGVLIGYNQITPPKAPAGYDFKPMDLVSLRSNEADFNMVMNHLFNMSKAPHETGSPENIEVQNYLKTQFEIIGTAYSEQNFDIDMSSDINSSVEKFNEAVEKKPELVNLYKDKGFDTYEAYYRSLINCKNSDILTGTNYLIKLDAPSNDKGIMFVSHYDSTRFGAGAADDLISVACMLEALRTVKGKNNFTNDIYFLFTDAEEMGCLGAKDFSLKNRELLKDIELIINLEARGSSGTLLMFETSENNKNIIKTINKAVDYNTMFSFMKTLYDKMPNNTDLSYFLEKDEQGINFALIDSPENYHTEYDNFENLNIDSAFMFFETTNKLAEYLSVMILTELYAEENAVYFPFFKGITIIIPELVNKILANTVNVVCILLIIFLFVKKRIKITGFFKAFLFIIMTLAISALLGYGGEKLLLYIAGKGSWIEFANTLNAIYYIICLFIILVASIVVYLYVKKPSNLNNLLIATLFLFIILNYLSLALLDTISYIFSIPLILMFSYILLNYIKPNKINKIALFALLIITSITLLMLFTPVAVLFFKALLSELFFINSIIITVGVIPIFLLVKNSVKLKS